MEHDTRLKTVGEREGGGGQGSDLVLLLVGLLYPCAPIGWSPTRLCPYWLGCYIPVLLLVRLLYPCAPLGWAPTPLCSYWLGSYTPLCSYWLGCYDPCAPIG